METIQLENRLTSIETRLSKIEGSLKISNQPPLGARETPSQKTASSDIIIPPPIVAHEGKPGNWLGIIAVICFVLAAGFIIKLSVESGWLTPTRQICLAALFGLGLIGVGLTLLRSDREYASLLPGAGVIVLYLTAFAAHRYYSLIPFEVALGITCLISGLCIWLYMEIEHDVYPITAAVGAYIAPAIMGLHSETVFSLFYFLACSITFATISVWVRSRTLVLVSAYLAIAITSLTGLNLGQDGLIATVLGLHFFIFSIGTYFYSRQNDATLSVGECWCFLPVLLIFYAMEYYYIDRVYPGLAPWISLAFSAVLVGLYLSAKKYFPDGLGSRSLVFAFVTIVCFHSIYLELLPVDIRPWLFVVIILGSAFSPLKQGIKKFDNALYIPAFALIAILAIEYLTMAYHLITEYSFSWLVVSISAFASIWLVLAAADDVVVKRKTYGHALLGSAHLLAILGLYRLTTDAGSLAVSASWLLYAVCVIVFAFVRKDQVMVRSALFVLGFAAGKALLYDAASAPTSVRIFCLLLTGAVLYGCGFFMRKTANWKNDLTI